MFFCYWRTPYNCTAVAVLVRADDAAYPKLVCESCAQVEGGSYVRLEDADLGLGQPQHGGVVR